MLVPLAKNCLCQWSHTRSCNRLSAGWILLWPIDDLKYRFTRVDRSDVKYNCTVRCEKSLGRQKSVTSSSWMFLIRWTREVFVFCSVKNCEIKSCNDLTAFLKRLYFYIVLTHIVCLRVHSTFFKYVSVSFFEVERYLSSRTFFYVQIFYNNYLKIEISLLQWSVKICYTISEIIQDFKLLVRNTIR